MNELVSELIRDSGKTITEGAGVQAPTSPHRFLHNIRSEAPDLPRPDHVSHWYVSGEQTVVPSCVGEVGELGEGVKREKPPVIKWSPGDVVPKDHLSRGRTLVPSESPEPGGMLRLNPAFAGPGGTR